MAYPYFQICTYGNMKDLRGWMSHFKSLNIPYAVTSKQRCKAPSWTTEFALWIVAQEVMSDLNLVGKPNGEPINGEIIETWGGFYAHT